MLLKSMALIMLLIFGFFAVAAQSGSHKPLVIYFGGKGSTQAQMDMWKAAAAHANRDYDYEAIPYPTTASSQYASAVSHGAALIEKYAERLNKLNGREVIIAGHSSGSALAIELAKRLNKPTTFRLVNLDGFRVPVEVQRKIRTTCWSAKNESTGTTANNYSTMRSSCGANFRQFTSTSKSCTSAWCLHFSLVNLNSGPGGGYSNRANLEWLKGSAPAPAATAGGSAVR